MSLHPKTNPKDILYELYVIPGITPVEETDESKLLLKQLQETKGLTFNIISSINDLDTKKLLSEIAMASQRGKFRVVSKGGAALAISGKKKLNHIHGPILLIRKESIIIDVYPKGKQGLKGSRISTVTFLKQAVESDDLLVEDIDDLSFTEQHLRNLIINQPMLLEEGLVFHKVEVSIESAIIDLVMIDKKGNHLLLEFKLSTKDRTIGQITRYNFDTYAELYNLPKEKIRKGIVTLSVTGQLVDACKTNNIELYVVKTDNLGISKE
ncbi:MAG: endonuclease NucS domain-containing protein [Candidatus Heimdallarchaeota archaeon]